MQDQGENRITRSRFRLQPVSEHGAAEGYKSTVIFEGMKKQFEKDGASYVKKINGILGFKVKRKDGKEILWIVDAKNGNGSLELNSDKKPDCTLTMNDEDLVDLMMGKLNPNTWEVEDIWEYGYGNEDSEHYAGEA